MIPPKKSFLSNLTPVTEGPASRLSPSLVVGEPFRLWGEPVVTVVFLLTGGPISWSSKLQASISQSSTEAEYVASTEAAKEAIWLCCLMKDLKQDTVLLTPLFIDNRGAQLLAKNPMHHSNTKHIDV